jgi:hypothetical protein
MDSRVIKQELMNELTKAVEDILAPAKNDLAGQLIYAFGVICDSGFVSMGGTLSTTQGLKNRAGTTNPAECDDLTKLVACEEWEYFGHYEAFARTNEILNSFFEVVYDDFFEDLGTVEMTVAETGQFIDNFFFDVIAGVLGNLKTTGCFSGFGFVDDVLVGLQFTDPSANQLRIIKSVSEKINSKFWHERVSQYCDS